MPRVGVLALQGDVREHVAMLQQMGTEAVAVRRPEHLDNLDGIILPGGESTTIALLLTTSGIRAALATKIREGLAVLGTCAGLILLGREVVDGRADQWTFGVLDVAVRRNGYGRQIASFETEIAVTGVGSIPGVFIRAPKIETWGSDVDVLASHDHGDGPHPVLVRQGRVWGCSFHPELTTDTRVHQLFLDAL